VILGNNNGQKIDIILNEARLIHLIDTVGKGIKEKKVKEKKDGVDCKK